jgi:pimeloyl-ACP methyl ester carboxylesterase
MPFARIGDVEIYYEIHGKGHPLTMILGLGQDIATWGLQIPELSEEFKVVIFDNRDSGRSSRFNGNYNTIDMAMDTLGLMDYLGMDRFHLLGTSMGGMVAQHVALMAPDRVTGLILVSTTANGGE